jgi:hypothetical protein
MDQGAKHSPFAFDDASDLLAVRRGECRRIFEDRDNRFLVVDDNRR